ncbi:MAG: efflux RND transporter periplasmic adaptor subunit [Steroidobacteraceae bacterium]
MSERRHDPDTFLVGQESIDARAWPRSRQLQAAAIGALVVVGLIVALWSAGRLFGKSTQPVSADAPSPPGTFRASEQQIKSLAVEAVGRRQFVSEEVTEGKIAVNADRATPLYSPYSGRVTRVIAGLGDSVKAGAPLATLEASEFVQAQNDLRTASAQVKIARIGETRKHALYDIKGGSLQDWQQAQADLATSESALNAARNRLRIFGKSAVQIDALANSRSIDPTATIVAPLDGIVVDRQIGPGQFLTSGSGTPVFTIADPSSVWLLANVREADAAAVHVGQAVDVRVLAYPHRVFKARVSYIAALVDPVTHRLPVRAEIDNHDGALKPEMFASFRIFTGDAEESPAVPASAVVYEGDAAHVWVLGDGGLLAYRAITTGRSSDGLVEVLQGLRPGERIVVHGALFIDQAAVPVS